MSLSGEAVSMEISRHGLERQRCSPGVELALAGTDFFEMNSVDLSVFSVEALDEVLVGRYFGSLARMPSWSGF
jgi:hypothetical protein